MNPWKLVGWLVAVVLGLYLLGAVVTAISLASQ